MGHLGTVRGWSLGLVVSVIEMAFPLHIWLFVFFVGRGKEHWF